MNKPKINHVGTALAIMEDGDGEDTDRAFVHAMLAFVEQQRRTADALERIVARMEAEPVNALNSEEA